MIGVPVDVEAGARDAAPLAESLGDVRHRILLDRAPERQRPIRVQRLIEGIRIQRIGQ